MDDTKVKTETKTQPERKITAYIRYPIGVVHEVSVKDIFEGADGAICIEGKDGKKYITSNVNVLIVQEAIKDEN